MRRSPTKRILSALLAVTLSIPAVGETRGRRSAPETPKEPERPPIEYMVSCPDLLAAENIEAALLSQIQNTSQMAQFLYDYRIIFSKIHTQAVISTLAEQGLVAPVQSLTLKDSASDDRQLGVKLRDYVLGLKKLALAPDADLKPLVWKILDNIAALNAAPDDLEAEVRFLQVSRLKETLLKSDKREIFENLMTSILRETLVLSAKQGIATVLRVWKKALVNQVNKRYFAAVATLTMGFLNYLGFDQDFLSNLHTSSQAAGDHSQYVFTMEHWPYVTKYYDSVTSAYLHERLGYQLWVTFWSAAFGGVAGLFSMVAVPGNIHVGARRRKYLRGLTPQLLTFPITQAGGRTIDRTVQSIWGTMESEVNSGVLSVEQACQEHICKLTPLQVAYLGHIDILELEEMRDALRESLKESVIDERLKSLRAAAETVVRDGSSYRTQMELKREIEFFINDLKTLADLRQTAKDDLLAKIDSVSQAMAVLKEKPYTDSVAMARDADIAKNEMLITKVNSDLGGLQQLKVNVEALNSKVESVRNILSQMETNLRELPKSAHGWIPVAERILLELDRIPGDGQ